MSKRKVVFANNEYYHLFNRSSGATPIYSGNRTLNRKLSLIDFYRYPQTLRFSKYSTLPKEEKLIYEDSFRQQKPIIEIYAYALMPTHYHLLVKQVTNNGIPTFISNIQNSFAKYFNTKNERSGSVYQNPFKAKHIKKDHYLLHLSRYIHLNPVTSYVLEIDKLETYPWTSFPYYLDPEQDKQNLINTSFIHKIIGSKSKYKEFVYNQADYQRKLAKIKELLID